MLFKKFKGTNYEPFLCILFILFCFHAILFAQGQPVASPETVGLSNERLKRVEAALNQYVEKKQIAVAWVLRHPNMTSALIGASRVSQIEEIVVALNNLKFTEGELKAIAGILAP